MSDKPIDRETWHPAPDLTAMVHALQTDVDVFIRPGQVMLKRRDAKFIKTEQEFSLILLRQWLPDILEQHFPKWRGTVTGRFSSAKPNYSNRPRSMPPPAMSKENREYLEAMKKQQDVMFGEGIPAEMMGIDKGVSVASKMEVEALEDAFYGRGNKEEDDESD
jgi:hypothetical protein